MPLVHHQMMTLRYLVPVEDCEGRTVFDDNLFAAPGLAERAIVHCAQCLNSLKTRDA
jgi:hypothetical protein